MFYDYKPEGVCSRMMVFNIEDNIIKDVRIVAGCQGNLHGISNLIIGMDVNEVIKKLEGIDCGGKGTSCPDQIAKGLKKFLEENKDE